MRPFLAALAFLLTALGSANATAQNTTGAGSSAAAPIYRSWAKAYTRATGATIEYDPVGSSGGVKKIRQNEVGFGASDVALSVKELTESGLATFPVAITGIAPVFHLPKVTDGQLRLSGEVLARVFMGEIGRWNAPEIAALNPGRALPDEPIKVIVRSDGSGTTYNFSDYLGKISTQWKAAHGAKTSIQWPQGFIGAKGSSGVAKAVKDTPYSIAYIDYGYVKEHGLSAAQMKNAEGEFVRPSVGAFRVALFHSEWAATGAYSETLTHKPGKGAWPITMGTFILVPKVAQNPERTLAALRFFAWAFVNGDALVQENNFVRLPDHVQAAAFKTMASVRDRSGAPIGMTALP
ncbi:phosphate ABC transporter substrate-binding protein PstS [Diaphorobacter sp.]|uniref:phosphate ABC transporter substrate-binding protein PstS n=1 Tax=Diaphorobacter sp. TaxID=1934310 RepID=UPI0025850BEF|nr:phosphate ABC transporter substrate-binding protein PstS [Diaphorobacter sp.]